MNHYLPLAALRWKSPQDLSHLQSRVRIALLDPSSQIRKTYREYVSQMRLVYHVDQPEAEVLLVPRIFPGADLAHPSLHHISRVFVSKGQIFLTLRTELGRDSFDAFLEHVPQSYIDPVQPKHIHPFSLNERYLNN